MERRSKDLQLIDGMAADLGGPRTADFLSKIDQAMDLKALADSIRADMAPEQPRGGRPFWPVELMLRCVLLAKWFGLSDPQLEEQLRDRLSFRRFVGLGLSDATPDETCFVNFRKRLRLNGHANTLFEGVLMQLRDRGLVLKEGSLIDATILTQAKGGKNQDGESTRDRCAGFTQKHGQKYHGFKASVNVSMDGLITDYLYDAANVHDSKHIDGLIEAETQAVYADSAYMSKQRSQTLAAKGIHDGIVQRRVRGQSELTAGQQTRNHAISRVRALVEHPFAWIKQMGLRRVRYRGLRRNGLDFALTALAYNMKRSLSLLGMPLAPARA